MGDGVREKGRVSSSAVMEGSSWGLSSCHGVSTAGTAPALLAVLWVGDGDISETETEQIRNPQRSDTECLRMRVTRTRHSLPPRAPRG
jgi:hypothetical protein